MNHHLVLTGNETGELRLWNAPSRPKSDMLLSSGSAIDSYLLTHALRYEETWSRKAFQRNPNDRVSMASRPGEGMIVTTKIERNGREHTLEYQVNIQE